MTSIIMDPSIREQELFIESNFILPIVNSTRVGNKIEEENVISPRVMSPRTISIKPMSPRALSPTMSPRVLSPRVNKLEKRGSQLKSMTFLGKYEKVY